MWIVSRMGKLDLDHPWWNGWTVLIFVPLISSMQSVSLINRIEQKRNQEEVLIDGEEEGLRWSKSILGSQLDVQGYWHEGLEVRREFGAGHLEPFICSWEFYWGTTLCEALLDAAAAEMSNTIPPIRGSMSTGRGRYTAVNLSWAEAVGAQRMDTSVAWEAQGWRVHWPETGGIIESSWVKRKSRTAGTTCAKREGGIAWLGCMGQGREWGAK